MLSIYPIMEALSSEAKSRLKKGVIGAGFIGAGTETVGKVGQKRYSDASNMVKKSLDDSHKKLEDYGASKKMVDKFNNSEIVQTGKKFINDTEEKAETFRKIRPTQIIKSVIDKYQDNK